MRYSISITRGRERAPTISFDTLGEAQRAAHAVATGLGLHPSIDLTWVTEGDEFIARKDDTQFLIFGW